MKRVLSFFAIVLLVIQTAGPVFAVAPEDIQSFESVATQSISEEDLTSPYLVTGESLVNIIQGMIDFDVAGSSIVFNRRTGQIFVKHTPTDQLKIEKIIRSLRSATFKQVEIEARLATVQATDFSGFGIDLADFNYETSYDGTQLGTRIPLNGSDEGTFANFESFVNALNDTTSGGQFSFAATGSNFNINAFIDALESVTEVNTLAAPKIAVFNNQRAHLKIEKRENFISEIDASFDTTSNVASSSIFFQIETKVRQAQSGTILDVTPTINSDGTIGLELHPTFVTADLTTNVKSITNLSGGNSFDNPLTLPIFVSQSIDTYLTIPNGGVAVLGGLITEEETKDFKKVPFFGDIPWIGDKFFTQEQLTDEQQYLLIFIKASVRDPK